MKNLKIISYSLFLILLAGGIYIYKKAQSIENPTFEKLDNIKFKNFSKPPDLKVTFSADAILNNPNDMGWTINKVAFDVYANGKYVSQIEQEKDTEIPANSNFALPLTFEIPISNSEIIKNFKDFVTGAWKEQSLVIRTVGAVYVNAKGIKFKIDFDYDDEYELNKYL